MLETRMFSGKMDCAKEVKRLYNASFPDDERIPWHILTAGLNDSRRMYIYYDQDQLIGLSYVFIWQDIAYLGYLAVEENLRDRGYGSRILKTLRKELEGYRIVIDIEIVVREADNYEERKKRRDFYLRNGFVTTSAGYYFYHVDYELLSCGGPVSAEEYRSLIIAHWGPRAKKAIFKTIETS